MLINTIVLFLRDFLPVAILIAWLTAFFSPLKVNKFGIAAYTCIAISSSILLYFYRPVLTESTQGFGQEWLIITLSFCLYILLLIGSVMATKIHLKTSASWLLLTALAILITIKASSFLVYFSSYSQPAEHGLAIYFGVIMATGIAISFAILLYFAINKLLRLKTLLLLDCLWAMYLAGIFAHISPLLSQINVLVSSQPLWDSQWLLSDYSEYGYLAKALIGYDATPSFSYLILYAFAGVSFFIGKFTLNHMTTKDHQQC